MITDEDRKAAENIVFDHINQLGAEGGFPPKTLEDCRGYFGIIHGFENRARAALSGIEYARRWRSVDDDPPPSQGRYLAWPSTVGEVCTALFWPETINGMWQDLEDHTEPWKPWLWRPIDVPPNAQEIIKYRAAHGKNPPEK